MAKRVKYLNLIFLLFSAFLASAQTESPEMADAMRANGKIYVVVTVLVIIFIGIVVYLVTIDRKTKRLENELNELKK